jgi:hypothetical protein
MTNGQSLLLGALDVKDPQEESVALHDLDPPSGNFSAPDMLHVSQAEPRPSPYAQHLHNTEKDDIVHKIINYHGKPPIHQLLSNQPRGTTTHNSPHTTPTLDHSPTTTTNRPPTSGNPGDNGKIIPIPPTHHIHPNGYNDSYDSSTKPLTAFSSDHTTSHRQKKRPPSTPGSDQSQAPANVPPGHVAINLQEGSKEEWFRNIKYALNHPERMRAANEIAQGDRPQPTQTIDHQEYEKACETLKKVDSRIPPDVIKKAIQLFFSTHTHLLPAYDLTQVQILELPSTNMIALILPVPDTSHFQMPPPFRKRQNHTWALLHGTTLRTSQLIKIRPANWSYHKNLQRCDMPTFGAFYLGREVSNSDKTIPDWAARELLDTIQKKGKGQQDIVIGAMYRGANVHTAYKAGGNEMAQLAVADKGIVTTSEMYTIAHSNHVGLKFVALKWQNLTDKIDVGDSSSDDVNYRTTEERHSGRR